MTQLGVSSPQGWTDVRAARKGKGPVGVADRA